MSGDELAIRLFFFATAIAVGLAVVSLAGWTHKALLIFLGATTVACFLIAIFWPAIAERWPSISEFMKGIVRTDHIFTGIVAVILLIFLFDFGLRLGWIKIGTGYTETQIRFEREPGSSINYVENLQYRKNIYTWKQVYVRREMRNLASGQTEVWHVDAFFIILDTPTPYNRPVLNAFGQNLPPYEFYLTSERGAVVMFKDTLTAPVFEITFPPPG